MFLFPCFGRHFCVLSLTFLNACDNKIARGGSDQNDELSKCLAKCYISDMSNWVELCIYILQLEISFGFKELIPPSNCDGFVSIYIWASTYLIDNHVSLHKL